MRLARAVVVAPDLDAVRAAGCEHPQLGALLDAGSFADVADVAPGPAAASALLGPAPAAELGAPGLVEGWNAELAAGAALALVVADARGRRAPLFALCGHGLPSMGALPPCAADDVRATLACVAGGEPPAAGRSLLEEPPSPLDAELEQQLVERLRQLYGE